MRVMRSGSWNPGRSPAVGRALRGTVAPLLLLWGVGRLPGEPTPRAPMLPSGVVETAAGRPAAGALVQAELPDGRTVTVYADEAGRFELPSWAEGADRVWARLPGTGESSVAAAAFDGTLRLGPDDGTPAPGAAWLAGLPPGEETRRFILDCTGCHVTDGSRVHVDGVPRDSAGWLAALELMVGQFGPGTGFPIVSSWVEPRALSGWLARSFAGAPAAVRPSGGTTPDVVLTEYPVPVPQDLPHDLMVDPEGRIVVTGMFTHRMYRLDPGTGAFEAIPIPEPGANPRALDIGPDGRWWVVLGGPGKVAVHDPAVGSWDVHDVGMYAHSIALDDTGRAWVNGHFTHEPERIASVDESGEVRLYTVPSRGAPGGPDAESTIPYGLRVGPDGLVWGTQLRGNRLVRLDPRSGAVEQWALPLSHSGPRRPDVAPDGSVWIPLYSGNALARFDPVRETFRVWDFPVEGALPYVARVDPSNGTVWIGTGHGDVVASFDPEGEEFTLYPLPTRGALIRHLDVDPERGEVWFAYGASPGIPGKILRLQTRP